MLEAACYEIGREWVKHRHRAERNQQGRAPIHPVAQHNQYGEYRVRSPNDKAGKYRGLLAMRNTGPAPFNQCAERQQHQPESPGERIDILRCHVGENNSQSGHYMRKPDIDVYIRRDEKHRGAPQRKA